MYVEGFGKDGIVNYPCDGVSSNTYAEYLGSFNERKLPTFFIIKKSPAFAELFFRRGDTTRTCDPLVPNQMRYQLRHTPKNPSETPEWKPRSARRDRKDTEIFYLCML